MNYYKLDVFTNFSCIGSACPETCCAGGWSIYIDDGTYEKYMSIQGDFGEKLKANIVGQPGKYCFRMDNDLRCPFLDESNLCEIYKEIGPDNMCFTCKTYPREMQMITENDMLMGFKVSCPEVARLLFSKKDKIELTVKNNGENRQISEEEQKTKELLLNGLVVSLSIVQNRRLKISKRLRLLILFNDMLEQEWRNGGDIDEVIKAFCNGTSQVALAENLNDLETESGLLTKLFLIMFTHFTKESGYLKMLAADVIHVVNRMISEGGLDMEKMVASIDDEQYEANMEQYLVYIIFKNYFKDGKAGGVINALRFPIFMYCLNACFLALYTERKGAALSFDETIVVYAHLSKYIEHNEKAMGEIVNLAEKAALSDTMALLGLV